MTERYIKFTKYEMGRYNAGSTQGYRYRVVVDEAVLMPKEIFVYQQFPAYRDNPVSDEFTNVASPADLEEYPVDEPTIVGEPFFRLSEIDLVFRSKSLAIQAWDDIITDITELVQTLNDMDILTVVEEVLIPATAQPSSSSGG